MKTKKISETVSVISDVMLPSQSNPAGNVHGGEIMKMIDTCGSVAAQRHSRCNVVTARVDELEFYEPIFVGQLVICEARLVFVGKTSMEVKVEVKVEDMQCDVPSRTVLTAFLTFVAIGENGKPCPVPPLETETEEEAVAYEAGRLRYLTHKNRRQI